MLKNFPLENIFFFFCFYSGQSVIKFILNKTAYIQIPVYELPLSRESCSDLITLNSIFLTTRCLEEYRENLKTQRRNARLILTPKQCLSKVKNSHSQAYLNF